MKISLGNGLSFLAISTLLVGCQATDLSEEKNLENETSQEATDKRVEKVNMGIITLMSKKDKIYAGYFKDSQVQHRALSDWDGDWQSVYPYLEDGSLDEVFAHKAEHEGKKSAEDYKEYYRVGYQTDVDRIVIKEDTITFYRGKKR